MPLSLSDAQTIAERARAHAETMGVPMNIAVVDAGGHLQVALAWLLQRSPVILPIPGTIRVGHLDENVAAAILSLTRDEIAELNAAA